MRLHRILLVALIAAAFFLAGCEGDDLREYDWSEFGDKGSLSDSPDGEDQGGAEAPPGDLSLSDTDISGVWAQLHVSSASSPFSLDGETASTTVTTWRLVMEQRGTDVLIHGTVCSVDIITQSTVVTTVVPDALVSSLEKSFLTASVGLDERGALRFYQPPYTEVRGARLADPVLDELPDDPEDPRVIDQDGDGKPGVTVRVTGLVAGELYIVQRRTNELLGRVHDRETIDGLMIWNNEQSTLGSDNPTLIRYQPEYIPNPNAAMSFFRSSRIEPSVTCEQITDMRDSVFRRNEDDPEASLSEIATLKRFD